MRQRTAGGSCKRLIRPKSLLRFRHEHLSRNVEFAELRESGLHTGDRFCV